MVINMKTIVRWFFFAAFVCLWTSCGTASNFVNCTEGSGKIITENRTVDAFDSVRIAGSANVFVTQESTPSLRVEAADNIMEKVRTTIDGHTLAVETDGGCFKNVKLNVYATMADIKRLEITGSGAIETKSSIKTDALDVVIKGSGDAKLNVTAKTVNTELKGSGDITFYGKADTLNINKSGSGDIRASNFLAQKSFVTTSGTGSCEVNAVEQLDLKNSGSGDIYYTSNPPQLTVSNTGSGKISKK